MQVSSVENTTPTTSTATTSSTQSSANGLDFQSLLNIILEQLTYQDPLQPMTNFEFVSQLAQFSQLEEAQALSTTTSSLLTAAQTTQAVAMLSHEVAVSAGSSTSSAAVTGTVTAVNLSTTPPTLTITASSGQIYNQIPLSSITSIQ